MGRGVPQGYMNKVSTPAIFLINKTQVDTFRQTDRQTDRHRKTDIYKMETPLQLNRFLFKSEIMEVSHQM